MFIETRNQPGPGLRRSPMFDAPHRAPLERLVFFATGHKHLAALRPGAKQHCYPTTRGTKAFLRGGFIGCCLVG
jgi:hypothetical protein